MPKARQRKPRVDRKPFPTTDRQVGLLSHTELSYFVERVASTVLHPAYTLVLRAAAMRLKAQDELDADHADFAESRDVADYER